MRFARWVQGNRLALSYRLPWLRHELAFAELKGPVKDRVRRYGLGRQLFFPTLEVAVQEYLRQTGVGWQDWEDQQEEGDG